MNGSSPTNLLEFGFKRHEKRIHEAQKPLELIEYLIKLITRKNQLILDPFMGSGTTAVAAKILRRNFIGFEVNPEYHAKLLERLEQAVNNGNTEELSLFQPTLFEKNG